MCLPAVLPSPAHSRPQRPLQRSALVDSLNSSIRSSSTFPIGHCLGYPQISQFPSQPYFLSASTASSTLGNAIANISTYISPLSVSSRPDQSLFQIPFMSDKEGNDDQDNQPPKPQRPSLPSIRSLFGITQTGMAHSNFFNIRPLYPLRDTDNLDAVLQNESGSGGAGSSSSPYDTRRPSRTPPGARPQAPQPSSHLPLHRPSSSRPPPSAFPPGDLGASLAGPSAPRDRRRSSASSQDLPGPSRGPASAPLSSTGASPRSPPESPESLISPRVSYYIRFVYWPWLTRAVAWPSTRPALAPDADTLQYTVRMSALATFSSGLTRPSDSI